ncbi:unnamed protein product [Acanthoscelides obtectus]|uniref:Uncharacterized protein n=1 Tax=Acanthoscelides obtectus TaxID=200917 RepID=A0A9P0M0Q2_ACAOB|nr:unnamed protein product [Acanthoscelides obtectus]CAK1655545.1 hypothetical protein AOBTE_LOCUS19213 [Acanthoscelides obtectus]
MIYTCRFLTCNLICFCFCCAVYQDSWILYSKSNENRKLYLEIGKKTELSSYLSISSVLEGIRESEEYIRKQ